MRVFGRAESGFVVLGYVILRVRKGLASRAATKKLDNKAARHLALRLTMNYDRSHAGNRSSTVCNDKSAVASFSLNCRYQGNARFQNHVGWKYGLVIMRSLRECNGCVTPMHCGEKILEAVVSNVIRLLV